MSATSYPKCQNKAKSKRYIPNVSSLRAKIVASAVTVFFIQPHTLSLALTKWSAPCWSKSSTISTEPAFAASWRIVIPPLLPLSSRRAPASSRHCMARTERSIAAWCKAVEPVSWFWTLTSAPAFTSNSTISSYLQNNNHNRCEKVIVPT